MDQINLHNLIQSVRNIAEETAVFITEHFGKVSEGQIEEKEENSLVSYVDQRAEEMIVEKLTALEVEAGFVTEEQTVANQQAELDYRWVIDPLDGTTNFLKGIPHFSVSIALEHHGSPILGVVQDVMLKDSYWAYKGGGAFLNDKAIAVSGLDELNKAIVVTGFPYRKKENLDQTIELFRFALSNCRGVRRLGSAALDMVFVAAGKVDCYYEGGLNRWDLSAGAIIAKEAGAMLSDFKAKEDYLHSGNILCANPSMHNIFLPKILAYST